MTKKSVESEPKQYIQSLKRSYVYGLLVILILVVAGIILIKPHDRPVKVASIQETALAHKQIISQYFLASTTCANDNLDHQARIYAFNKYFKVNQFANRAVIRGCNDNDRLLAKTTDGGGAWLPTEVNITLNTRQNPQWQKACLIDDITTADTVVRPENSSIDANNLSICNKLRTVSYISVSIHFNF